VPAVFAFQTTDPATNKVTGSPNTAVSIAAGATQSFVLAFTPNAAFDATPSPFTFACGGLSPAPVAVGVNYFTPSASATPVAAPSFVRSRRLSGARAAARRGRWDASARCRKRR